MLASTNADTCNSRTCWAGEWMRHSAAGRRQLNPGQPPSKRASLHVWTPCNTLQCADPDPAHAVSAAVSCAAAAHLPVSQALQAAWAAPPSKYYHCHDTLLSACAAPAAVCFAVQLPRICLCLKRCRLHGLLATRQHGTGGCCPTAGTYWWRTCQTLVSAVSCMLFCYLCFVCRWRHQPDGAGHLSLCWTCACGSGQLHLLYASAVDDFKG
jgi:hypothetical protein